MAALAGLAGTIKGHLPSTTRDTTGLVCVTMADHAVQALRTAVEISPTRAYRHPMARETITALLPRHPGGAPG